MESNSCWQGKRGMPKLEISNYSVYEVILACTEGDIKVINNAFATGHNVNGFLAYRNRLYTPLMIACICSNYKCAMKLLEMGADPNIIHEDGVTPFHIVLQSKEKAFIDLMIKFNANPNVPVHTQQMSVLLELSFIEMLQ